MKCETVQPLIARYLRGEVPSQQREEISRHLMDCANCREEILFHRSIESRMDGPIEVPSNLRHRISERLESQPSQPSILARFLGEPTMKKILISSSALTAAIIGAVLLAPGTAQATTPLNAFKAMRSALAGAVRSGELRLTGSVTGNGTVTVSGTLDGQPLPPDIPLLVNVDRHENVYDITITANLAPSNYSSIKYGKDPSTLELVPKDSPNKRIEVGLDPVTSKPKSWSSFSKVEGLWKPTGHYDFKPKATGKPKVDDTDIITAHMKMTIASGPAAMSVKGN